MKTTKKISNFAKALVLTLIFANSSNLFSQSDTIKTNTVNVGVLYSSNFGKDYSQISTFCLANLESSVFNMSNYIFSNPKIKGITNIELGFILKF